MGKETVGIHFDGLVKVVHRLPQAVQVYPAHRPIGVVVDHVGRIVYGLTESLFGLVPIIPSQTKTAQYRPRVAIVGIDFQRLLHPSTRIQCVVGIQIGFSHQGIGVGQSGPSLQNVLQVLASLFHVLLIIAR